VIVQHLERTRDAFVDAVHGLSDAQHRYAPSGRWSIADIAEHVALAEMRTIDLVARKLPQGPAPSAAKLTGPARFARIDAAIPSRDLRRIEAPEPLVPTGRWPTVEASLAAFLDARRRSLAAAAAVTPEALAHVVPHRFLGEFDLEEWLYFTSVHLARHTAQVDELKHSAEFPAA
jgi:hypothetical protein